jgi:hypothetical protein
MYQYTICEDGVHITGCDSAEAPAEIPQSIAGKPVTVLEKKAFFNCRGLHHIEIPASVCRVEDWAFAHCPNLETVRVAALDCLWGRNVFAGCPRFAQILWNKPETDPAQQKLQRQFGTLLAAAYRLLDADYLFQTNRANDLGWYALWDARMMTILREDDMEGYTRLLLCGEEDCGSDEAEPQVYQSQRRKRKVRIAFLRLLNDYALAQPERASLQAYLLEHTKGCPSEETWEVLRQEHGEDGDYIRLFLQIGAFHADNMDRILQDLGAQDAQLGAYLMRYREEKLQRTDFFDTLQL